MRRERWLLVHCWDNDDAHSLTWVRARESFETCHIVEHTTFFDDPATGHRLPQVIRWSVSRHDVLDEMEVRCG